MANKDEYLTCEYYYDHYLIAMARFPLIITPCIACLSVYVPAVYPLEIMRARIVIRLATQWLNMFATTEPL